MVGATLHAETIEAFDAGAFGLCAAPAVDVDAVPTVAARMMPMLVAVAAVMVTETCRTMTAFDDGRSWTNAAPADGPVIARPTEY